MKNPTGWRDEVCGSIGIPNQMPGKPQLAGQQCLHREAPFDEQQKTRRTGDQTGVYGVSPLGLS